MAVTLYGYRYSVYTRIVLMTLTFQKIAFSRVEVDPFADPPDSELAKVTRFGRVPVQDHDGFRLCETTAITRYLATAFPSVDLIPTDPRAQARADQVIAVIDAYGYWPMVRQVFSHAVFRPLIKATSDPSLIADGVQAAQPVLAQLDDIAAEGLVLNGRHFTRADLHLAPVLGYFTAAPQGATALMDHASLSAWWAQARTHPAYRATDLGLATAPPEA